MPNGEALHKGVVVGDRVVCVGPHPVPASKQGVMDAIVGHAARPLRLTLSRPRPDAPGLVFAEALVEGAKLGLAFDDGGLVKAVAPGGEAERRGVAVGDRISCVGAAPTAPSKDGVMKPILAHAARPLRLTLCRPEAPRNGLEAFVVDVAGATLGLAFDDVGRVTAVMPGGEAEAKGLRVGDHVARAGATTAQRSKESVLAAIKAHPQRPLRLCVCREREDAHEIDKTPRKDGDFVVSMDSDDENVEDPDQVSSGTVRKPSEMDELPSGSVATMNIANLQKYARIKRVDLSSCETRMDMIKACAPELFGGEPLRDPEPAAPPPKPAAPPPPPVPDSDDDDDVSKYMIPPDDDEPPEAPEPEPEPEPAEPEPEPGRAEPPRRASAGARRSRRATAPRRRPRTSSSPSTRSPGDDVGSRLFNDVFASPAPRAAAAAPWKPAAPRSPSTSRTRRRPSASRRSGRRPRRRRRSRGDGAWRPDAASPRGFEPVALPEPGRVSESHKRTVDTLAGKFEEKMKWERRGDDPVVIHKTPSKKVQTLHKALSDLDLKSPAVVEQRARRGPGPRRRRRRRGGRARAVARRDQGYSSPPPSREMKAADSDEEMVEFDFVDFGLEADMVVS
ncbi:hypothetical protein JL720_2332 [Aureococcus anophagefferens]|nr:hypothetical protein JL720_2332 [Aureococcus anophagefferens]